MNIRRLLISVGLVSGCAVSSIPETHEVTAYFEAFAPLIVYVEPGDTIQWTNMTACNTVSIDELLPHGAKGWRSRLDEDFAVSLNIEGVYPYTCEPDQHVGMYGIVVVGFPQNIDEAIAHYETEMEGRFRNLPELLYAVKAKEPAF